MIFKVEELFAVLARLVGFEPTASGFGIRHSIP